MYLRIAFIAALLLGVPALAQQAEQGRGGGFESLQPLNRPGCRDTRSADFAIPFDAAGRKLVENDFAGARSNLDQARPLAKSLSDRTGLAALEAGYAMRTNDVSRLNAAWASVFESGCYADSQLVTMHRFVDAIVAKAGEPPMSRDRRTGDGHLRPALQ
jgi:hypothetical protein